MRAQYSLSSGGDAGGESGASDEERLQNAMKDPEVAQIMTDPVMRVILDQMQKDPAAAADHLKNPQVKAKIEKLIQAGIIRVGRQ